MLEGLAAWVLNTYVGGYVENLNTHQLSIGLLRGQVELENLPLKKDAFRHLLLPLEIKAGFIGKLSLKIPVTRLRSEPWVITIEQLYVIVGPVSLNEYDEEKEEQVLQNAKLSKLDAMEAKWKASNESRQEPSYYAYSYAAWLTCGNSLMTNITKNLQFKIKDVHLRYEDGFTDSQNPFACGITIQALSSQGASAKEEQAAQASAEEDIAHQSLQLNGCAVYWDTDVTMLGGLDVLAMAEAMKKHQTHFVATSNAIKPHTYLLANTSSQAQISRNCSPQPLRSHSKPRIVCNLQLDRFSITLNEDQYKQMVFCLRELERINLSWKYRRWRPDASVQGNVKRWWEFALQAHTNHLRKQRSQSTWAFACQRARQVKSYVEIYYCHLTRPESLTTEKQKEKDLLEQQLEFETLLSLRELVIQRVRREQAVWTPGSRGQGLLQYWFPGWTGWYTGTSSASSSETTETEGSDFDDASSVSTSLTSQIEEEILDVLDSVDSDTFLMRDTVLAHVGFSLSQCTFTLAGHRAGGNGSMQPLIELRFAEVTLDVESRPRLGSLLLATRLGSLHLVDRTAENSLYPHVLAPHSMEPLHVFPKVPVPDGPKLQSSIFKFFPFSTTAGHLGSPLLLGDKTDFPPTPLFELTYERKPLGSSADHRLVVNTQSLDVVYNPSTIRTIKQFFTLYNYGDTSSKSSPRTGDPLNLSAAARSRYEMFKKHTKEELRHRWDLMLEGKESSFQVARWDVQMNICAPQIIVPESFTDNSSTVVLVDLGRVQFSNTAMFQKSSPDKIEELDDNDDDDDSDDDEGNFKTPCSSPPEDVFPEEQSAKKPGGPFLMKECSIINDTFVIAPVQAPAVSEADILDRMYKRYTLNLQDMQVLVGSGKESWKFAQSKGTSRMHVLDRFSICIQVERRLLATDDPHWPSVIVTMKLPRLTAHVNEQKVQAVQMCLLRLQESTSTRPSSRTPHGATSPPVFSDPLLKNELPASENKTFESKEKDPHELSLLLLAQCSIEQMCLEVQSRGRCIAELQVTGVQATYSKRPLDSSVTMSVHGLLLVDALQTYGPDFELLVASHKHVSMDSRSGSIRDSDPNSPTSPSSPPVPSHSSAPMQTIAVPKILSAILSTLHTSPPKVLMNRHCASPIGILDSQESDALITVEVTMVNIPSSQDASGVPERVFIAAVQFNNLDVIANQETIVELVHFARCFRIKDTPKAIPGGAAEETMLSVTSSPVERGSPSQEVSQNQINSMQLTFDFHRFNVLLLRAVSRKGNVSGQKVATATVSGARIQASIGSSLEIQGTLGGLQVCDLISDKTLHRRIVSMGSDPHISQDAQQPFSRHARLYRTTMSGGDSADSQKALEFTIRRSGPKAGLEKREAGHDMLGPPGSERLDVVARMASVCYTHSPQLLHELASCAVEFKHFMSVLAKSIRDAAAEVALGIVNMPAQSVVTSFHVGSLDHSPAHGEEPFVEEPEVGSPTSLPLDVKLDILLQTPVIILPCSASSCNVLVAHLGRISVQNMDSSLLQSPQFAFNSCDPHKANMFFVQFRDVNLFSLNIEDNLKDASAKTSSGGLVPDLLSVSDLYSCVAHGCPILHDTVIEFTVEYRHILEDQDTGWFNEGFTSTGADQGDVPVPSTSWSHLGQPTLEISGTVINVLKFALTKHQYELMLQSTENITYCSEMSCLGEDDPGELMHFCSSWENLTSKDLMKDQDKSHPASASLTEDALQERFIRCHINFVLPEFIINLCSDLCNDKQDLVALSFQEFVVNYEKYSSFETNIQLALKAVLMEDLMENPESSHRCLIRSSNLENQQSSSRVSPPPKSDFISVSCPDMTYHMPALAAHPSLPDRLCTENVFQAHLKRNRPADPPKKSRKGARSSVSAYPFTPPPSPSGSASPMLPQADSLMHIHVHLVDRHSPHFVSQHNKVSRRINVDLNSLETMVNSHTWVMVLDFLGMTANSSEGSKITARQDSTVKEDTEPTEEPQPGANNTELEVNIHNFTVTLNKPMHELARASISGFSSHLSLRDSDIMLRASLGKISVLDLTPHGHIYRERFVTAGREALHFDVFQYGTPDPALSRDCDIKIKCEMSSVQVVHTHHFIMEVIDFFADFSDLQMSLRAATAGNKMNLEACRSPRVQLELTAGSPVIVIPQSYNSHDVLVANLGNLTVSTKFQFVESGDNDSSPSGTMSSQNENRQHSDSQNPPGSSDIWSSLGDSLDEKCLLQVMNMELADMDLYSGVCLSNSEVEASGNVRSAIGLQFPSFHIQKSGGPLLKRTFMLHLQVEKNLDSFFNHSVPDWTVHGSFSSVHFTLDHSQYKLVHGILVHNLGESIERPSPNLLLAKLFPEQDSHCDKTWAFLAIYMDLVNVTLELVHAHPRPNCANSESALAKIDLIRSRLTLERYSDNSSDIDLVSHEICVSDTRFKDAPVNNRPNVFTNILQPTKNALQGKVLQAEIHYRVTHNQARFTVLLNNMRVMAIFSWITELSNFLSVGTSPPDIVAASSMHSRLAESPSLRRGSALKRQLLQQAGTPLELKLNMTDTEIVVVEDSAALDTNAVILKSTAVLAYQPGRVERPLSCNLQNLEVFSCILGLEDDTALSIVDPISVFIDIVEKASASSTSQPAHILQIGTMNLNLRLSYHDMKLFLRILDSIPKQSLLGKSKSHGTTDIEGLLEMGFAYQDCVHSLKECKGNLDEAAIWLTQNAAVKESSTDLGDWDLAKAHVNVCGVELKVSYLCLCIIDDCMDADVPLLEINLRETYISQELDLAYSGESKFFFSTGYYNRALSGWEPIIEPWRCNCHWEAGFNKHGLSKFIFKINAEDVLNVNITTALLDLYQRVKKSWASDFYELFSIEGSSQSRDSQGEVIVRRRSPFIPFALKNDLGIAFSFATVMSTTCGADKEVLDPLKLDWKDVAPGQVVPFTFQGREKLRHQDSHALRMHQLILRVDGYQQLDPVSVDKVGVYFKYARPRDRHLSSFATTRVVFNVTLDGNARKLITVQSALVIKNRIEIPLDLKLELLGVRPYQVCLQPKTMVAIPLPFVRTEVWVRPAFSTITYSYSALQWEHVVAGQSSGNYSTTCCPIRSDLPMFRFSVGVKRENYPDREGIPSNVPAHTIVLLPPITIHNLLPYDLDYGFKETPCRGIIAPQKSCPLHEINTDQYIIIDFSLENFRRCTSLVIPPGSSSFATRLETHDTEGRLLVLHARVIVGRGRAVKVFVSAPYWIINRSGLPLIFKQEGTNCESAGQFKEHEQARSVAPLLFSYADTEASMMCCMRLGMGLHPRSFPQWCTCFSLEKGSKVRRLMVSPNDNRPDWVYTIGVDIRQGRGNYSHTNYVVLSPRFLMDNQSSSVVQIAQRFATKEQHQNRHHISLAKPKSSLPFHWPRVDLDNLLCVRLVDIPGCLWSGGFKIDELDSFHVHMRDEMGKSYFLRVEVILKGATFFIIFMDCSKIPPPLRIDNQSEVAVTFHQTSVGSELLKAVVKAHTSVPYAWDEPTLAPYITVTAPGGKSETYDMTSFREGEKLYYENFFYIAFSGTFLEPRTVVKLLPNSKDVKCQELVLDVPQGTRVVINKKEVGKRSQLWRMTSTGLLQHEGSSTPREPRLGPEPGHMLVLDIAGLGPEPKKYTELMLRKPDERRRLTQTWQFMPDGRLCCQLPGMFVQPRDGFVGLRRGNDVVLGPPQPVSFMCMDNGIPLEQAVVNQKMRGGSGVLSVRINPKGPTIVLCITDFRHKQIALTSSAIAGTSGVSKKGRGPDAGDEGFHPEGAFRLELEVKVHLAGGLGVSVINHLSEELLYALLQNVRVNFSQGPGSQLLDASVENIQVDNQLHGAERPVALYVTPLHDKDRQRHLPAILITAERLPQRGADAVIFQHFIMQIKNLTVALEEQLLLKVAQFLYQGIDEFNEEVIPDNQVQRAHAAASANAKRFYFNTLKLRLDQVKLSVLTMSQRPPELDTVKKKTGWSLMRFEDVAIELDSFVKSHPFESLEFLVNNVIEHYKSEFGRHAAKILGAVGFLGDPVGLISDVSTGWSEFINEGKPISFIKGVTHGLSNSTAKAAGSISDGLTTVAMTNRQQAERSRNLQDNANSSMGHLATGFKLLGTGVVGGFTSIARRSYQGATTEGVQGLITGLCKGLVGTVAMPTVGILDLISEAASAVRDTSKPPSHVHPNRCRAPRLCTGPGGLLPCYSTSQALGQQFLCNLNDDIGDLYVSMELLERRGDVLRVLISTERAFILKREPPFMENVLHVIPYGSLSHCRWFPNPTGAAGDLPFCIEFSLRPNRQSPTRHSPTQVPEHGSLRVGCDSEATARKVVQQINYARDVYEERSYTAHLSGSDEDA